VTGATELAGSDAAALALVVLSLALPATALLARRRARAAATAMLLTAGGLTTAALVTDPTWARALGLLTGLLLAPLVVLTFPRLRTRHPVDFLALVTVGGATSLAIAVPASSDTMGLVVLVLLIGHVWWSLEHSHGADRRALTWLALAAGSSTLAAGVLGFTIAGAEATAPWWVTAPFAVVGPALYVGASRPDVADTRVLVVDVVAHATALVLVLGVFVGVAAPLAERGLGSSTLAVLGLLAAALASAYHPVRQVLRATVAEVVLGRRPDPLTAVRLVTDSLGEDPAEALHAVREALLLPWAAVLSDPPVTSGDRPERVVLVALGEVLPELEVGLPSEDERLSRADARLLTLAAPLLGQSLRLHALATQLQASREHTVVALEEERSRLRRDLHDGLGPLLSGLAFTTDAARNLLHHDPDRAAGLLADVRAQAETALEDVRDLVYGMRPPALDELGLVPAIRQAVSGLVSGDGDRVVPPDVRICVEPGEPLLLPPAVEVALYRIAVEAVGNAVRHTRARRVRVGLWCGPEQVRLEVADDAPPGPPWSSGVGLASMHERAAELGGRLEAGPSAAGGLVRAVLPVHPGSGG
jgi:two-component system NarL family sensor kinase